MPRSKRKAVLKKSRKPRALRKQPRRPKLTVEQKAMRLHYVLSVLGACTAFLTSLANAVHKWAGVVLTLSIIKKLNGG